MEYRRMGRSGLKASAFGLGGWTTFGGSVRDEDLVREIVRAAFDRGVNVFDIADVYARGEAERMMGAALRDLPRERLVITSKVFWPMSDDVNDRGLSRKHIMESVEASLRRIGTDYLDCYFCHRYDPETPLEETHRAMDDLVRQGKVLYWGTSEWSGRQLREAHALAEKRHLYAPAVEQPQLSLLKRRRFAEDVQPAAQELGMGLFCWSPLASGLLTGKYDDKAPPGARLERIAWLRAEIWSEESIERVRRMAPLADEVGCTRTQLALAWALRQPGVTTVLLGATRLEQLEENLGALEIALPSEVLAGLDALFAE